MIVSVFKPSVPPVSYIFVAVPGFEDVRLLSELLLALNPAEQVDGRSMWNQALPRSGGSHSILSVRSPCSAWRMDRSSPKLMSASDRAASSTSSRSLLGEESTTPRGKTTRLDDPGTTLATAPRSGDQLDLRHRSCRSCEGLLRGSPATSGGLRPIRDPLVTAPKLRPDTALHTISPEERDLGAGTSPTRYHWLGCASGPSPVAAVRSSRPRCAAVVRRWCGVPP